MSWTGCSALLAFLALACGGSDKSTPEEPGESRGISSTSSSTDDSEEDTDDIEVEGLKGHLQPVQIEKGMAPHQTALARCYKSHAKKSKFLAGKLVVKFVVGPDGTVKKALFEENDLGSWAVERCVLEIARAMSFAEPKGGDREAEFTVPLEFAGTRRVDWWPEEKVQTVVEKKIEELEECAEQNGVVVPSNVFVTFYIGNRGAVPSVGFVSPGKPVDDAWAECAAGIVAGWTMPDPMGTIAKTGFRYRPE
ncbi:MAG TPA: AgmX/PglI C-terminal domain-containing protein [Kofleriaceae bacterium]